MNNKMSWFLKASLLVGLLFLYIPLFILVIYSFNASNLVTVWGGFSFKWWSALLHNREILSALWLSMRVALASSLMAVILATMAAYALERVKIFKGSSLFAGMVSAPMVMPEVITGLSMLMLIFQVQILFQAVGLNTAHLERGFFTIWLGHTTMVMAYATVVIRARLAEMDVSLEEAAKDLGAKPFKIFFTITLPLIIPALISAFLLGVTLSLDDLVIASFLSGPGSSTLPMIIFSQLRRGLDPQMNVLATLLIVLVATLVITGNYWMMKSQSRKIRESAEAGK